jgi:N-acetyl-gamma-glutamyl-phosphate reductase
VILCLPDDAAVDAVAMLDPSSKTVIIDASTAFRTAPGWAYGFPELTPTHAATIAASKRIANPGCYPTGFIALTRPLVDAGLLPVGAALTCHAVSGYSGGGKALIKVFEEGGAEPYGAYGFNLAHKHLPEMGVWSRLGRSPVFCPAVGSFAQGMLVSVPLHLSQLAQGVTGESMHAALAERYAGCRFVSVMPLRAGGEVLERGAFLRPDALNGTNQLQLFVYANEAEGTALLLARLDNLGKGASGAAVQNLNLALGLEEAAGLL